MTLKPALRTSVSQRLALTPGMRQSLEMLRLTSEELSDLVGREADSNPFLICETVQPSRSASAYEIAVQTAAATPQLHDSLMTQLAQMRLTPAAARAAQLLIVELRGDGYLDTTLEDLADELSIPIAELAAGLDALQHCEPAGIGARGLAECLTLQLRDRGLEPDLAQAVVAHLGDFAEARWTRLSAKLGLPVATLEKIAETLRGLSSAPVLPDAESAATRIPDLIIERRLDDTLSVRTNPEAVPRLSLLTELAETARTGDDLRARFANAQFLIRALAARTDTLLRIGREIAALQPAFFLGDHTKLAAVSRAELAARIDMHPSTIGRAVAGKYLVADGKVIELSMFFSKAIETENGAVSAFTVQKRIAALILSEPADAPLSDDEIRAALVKEGVDISRRTVAKYRKCVRVPSSYERRRRKVFIKNRPPIAQPDQH